MLRTRNRSHRDRYIEDFREEEISEKPVEHISAQCCLDRMRRAEQR